MVTRLTDQCETLKNEMKTKSQRITALKEQLGLAKDLAMDEKKNTRMREREQELKRREERVMDAKMDMEDREADLEKKVRKMEDSPMEINRGGKRKRLEDEMEGARLYKKRMDVVAANLTAWEQEAAVLVRLAVLNKSKNVVFSAHPIV